MCSDHLSLQLVRNPLDYTTLPETGDCQCNGSNAECGNATAVCSAILQNNPGYIVNDSLNGDAPPPIQYNLDQFHYFIYWGAQTFPNHAEVPESRRAEFERLLLKLNPTRDWIVTLVDYV